MALCDLQQNHGKLAPSMYADPEPRYPLERCLRVLPHHNDTGGFFVAVLRKTSEITSPRCAADGSINTFPRAEALQDAASSKRMRVSGASCQSCSILCMSSRELWGSPLSSRP